MKFKKLISSSLAIGLLFNTTLTSFASTLSEDGRYETFEGNNIAIDNILEEDKVDVEIEGNTMVNLVKMPSITKKTIEVTTGWPTILADFTNKNNIKPNTTYTYIVDVSVSNASDNFHTYINMDYLDSNNKSIYHDMRKSQIIGNGKSTFIKTFTTNDDAVKFNNLFIVADTTDGNLSSGTQTVTNMILLEGDYSNTYTNYFEGMKSVAEKADGTSELEIKSNNKNLLNLLDLKIGKKENVQASEIQSNSLKINVLPENTANYASVYFDGMRFIPGVRYRISGKCEINKGNGISPRFSIRDISYDSYLVSGLVDENGNINATFTATNYRHRVEFFSGNHRGDISDIEVIFKDLQITIDDNSIVEYEPYNLYNTRISLNEPLRGLPNGVKDRIIKRNGQWYIERNCKEHILDGNERWDIEDSSLNNLTNVVRFMCHVYDKDLKLSDDNIVSTLGSNSRYSKDIQGIYTDSTYSGKLWVHVNRDALDDLSVESFKKFLSENNISFVSTLSEPIYEPLNIDSTINLYLNTTHISNSSTIPANMKATIDRAINRAVDAIELAKANPTVENLSKARMWINLLDDSIKKDELQSEINDITDIEDLQLERKTATSNIDVYIKSENMLLMSLSTNSITFNDYSGIDDMELNNAVSISINSSLPYQLNSYLLSEIENSDKSNRIEKDLLNIKSSSDTAYKIFDDINEKLILENDCNAGNNKSHSIDLKLKGGDAHKADAYKTVIKFEAEQK